MQRVHPDGQCDPEMLKFISNENEDGSEGEERETQSGETDPRWDALKQLLEK
jgi:uncharacterized metal-binding protein YceD (DUF177 family)